MRQALHLLECSCADANAAGQTKTREWACDKTVVKKLNMEFIRLAIITYVDHHEVRNTLGREVSRIVKH